MNLSICKSSSDVLSTRELLVLRLISEGCSTSDISALLTLPMNTVESYRKAIREKLAAKDTMPLFDTARFTRNLEAAYCDMLDKT